MNKWKAIWDNQNIEFNSSTISLQPISLYSNNFSVVSKQIGQVMGNKQVSMRIKIISQSGLWVCKWINLNEKKPEQKTIVSRSGENSYVVEYVGGKVEGK